MRRPQIEQAIEALQAQSSTLPQAIVDTAVSALKGQLSALDTLFPAEQKEITILVANISGLANLTETLAQEAAYQTLNTLWERMDKAIIAHGGFIETHSGSGVIALFGVDNARENEPEWAIRAALAMQAELREIIRAKADIEGDLSHAPHLHLRVGINTGPVLMAPIGGNMACSALGVAVTIAGRLEYAAPEGSILISHQTYHHVRGVFYVQPIEPVLFKDVAAPLDVYVVRGAKPHAIRVISRGVEGVETQMVGRDTELLQLKQAFYNVMGENCIHIVLVSGESGIGKSRLLYEFDQWLELLPMNMTFLQGRASRQTNRLPCWVIRDLFCFYFDIQASDLASVSAQKLKQGIVDIFGADGEEMAATIGHLIGFDFSQNLQLRSDLDDPRQIHQKAVDYIVELFAEMTKDGCPVVIVLEDIHWADKGSLDVISRLANCDKNIPLLIICTTRPILFSQYPGWGDSWKNHTRLELIPLTRENSFQLINEILQKAPEIPSILRDLLTDHAQGNPLFIEEMIKLLIEEGVIRPSLNRWQINADQLPDTHIPMTLYEILRIRFQRLPLLERESLQKASVIGRAFWNSAIAKMGQSGSGEMGSGIVDVVLEGLQEKELVLKREASAFAEREEYVFKHTLLQQVTYDTLAKDEAALYHSQIARWLIEENGEQADAYAALIAGHYKAARHPLSAASWYTRAGKQAQNAYVLSVALEQYQQALDLWASENTLTTQQLSEQIDAYQGAITTLLWLAETDIEDEIQPDIAKLALITAGDFLTLTQKTGREFDEALAWRLLGQAATHALSQNPPSLGAGTTDPATCFATSLNLFTKLKKPYQRALTLQAWAEYEQALGDALQGESMRQEAEEILIKLEL